MADVFERWPKIAKGVRDRSDETIARTAEKAGPFLRSFGSWTLERMERAQPEVAAWTGKHPGNARYARTIMLDARAVGWITVSPFAGISVPAKGNGGRDTSYVPTRDEVAAIAAAGERHGMTAWVWVQADCGARLSAMTGLVVGQVQAGPTPETLRVWLPRKLTARQKRRKATPRYPGLLLEDGARAIAPLLEGRAGNELVWRRPRGRAWDRETVSRRFRAMREEAGLPEAFTTHALRRHFATRLADMGVAWDDIALLLDHVDEKGRPNTEMTRAHYTFPDRDAAIVRAARKVAA